MDSNTLRFPIRPLFADELADPVLPCTRCGRPSSKLPCDDCARAEERSVADPDRIPSARIALPPDDWQFEHRPFANGLLSSFEAKLPTPPASTPPEQYSDAMVASILDRIGVELAGLSANLRKVAATMAPKDGAA